LLQQIDPEPHGTRLKFRALLHSGGRTRQHNYIWESNMSQKRIKDLGYANGWRETPRIVTECEKLGHTTTGRESHMNCVTITICKICKYEYKIDSSG